MIQARRVPLSKKSFKRSSISARVLFGERISTAKSGAPGKNDRVDRLNPSATSRSRLIKETSGARQFLFFIQKPVLESRTAPNRFSRTNDRRTVNSSKQI